MVLVPQFVASFAPCKCGALRNSNPNLIFLSSDPPHNRANSPTLVRRARSSLAPNFLTVLRLKWAEQGSRDGGRSKIGPRSLFGTRSLSSCWTMAQFGATASSSEGWAIPTSSRSSGRGRSYAAILFLPARKSSNMTSKAVVRSAEFQSLSCKGGYYLPEVDCTAVVGSCRC